MSKDWERGLGGHTKTIADTILSSSTGCELRSLLSVSLVGWMKHYEHIKVLCILKNLIHSDFSLSPYTTHPLGDMLGRVVTWEKTTFQRILLKK